MFAPINNRKGWRRITRMRRHLNRTLHSDPAGDTAALQAELEAIAADPAFKHKIVVLPPRPKRPHP